MTASLFVYRPQSERHDSLSVFRRDLQQWPLLPPEQSVQLGWAAKRLRDASKRFEDLSFRLFTEAQGDEKILGLSEKALDIAEGLAEGRHEILNQLVSHNMRLVFDIASKIRRGSLELADKIQEGSIGLMVAAERFRPELGWKFSTYATHWIRQTIQRAVHDKAKAIRVPVHAEEKRGQILQARHYFFNLRKREPDDDELADLLGMSVSKLKKLLESLQVGTVGLEDMVQEDEHGNRDLGHLYALRDALAGDEEALLDSFSGRAFQPLLHFFNNGSGLTPRERLILCARIGIEEFEDDPKTLEEIGRWMGVTRERIRQVETDALRKLEMGARFAGLAPKEENLQQEERI